MTSTCPACNKSIDPLRSRFVRVVGGKVVAYCSAECLGTHAEPGEAARTVSPATGVPTAIQTPPTGVPARATPAGGVPARATPAAGVPARSTPLAGVPARTTPGAGVPAGRTPAAGVPLGPPLPVTPALGAPAVVDSGPVIEILHEPASGVVTSARDERTGRAKHPDEIPIAEFWSVDKERSAVAGEPRSGPVPSAISDEARDTTERTERGASEADDAGPRRSSLRLVLLVLLLLAAGGLLVYQYLLKHDLAAATGVPAPLAPPAPPAGSAAAAVAPARPAELAVEPPVVDPAAAIARARATLQADLGATSLRLQRLAAAALARTEDAAARDFLAAQLGLTGAARVGEAELSDIARLDLAYSLARSGDRRGNDALAQALASQRAEARDEAARLLALLGDRRAVPHLTDLFAVTQRRLGAAEHLAHLADPHAIKVLEQLCADTRTSANDKARATIALATAGRASVAQTLRGMLGDPHFNAFAAAALAELKDAAARPVLEYQLDSPSLRVRAARALRRLDPDLDPRPVLPHLLDVLGNGRDRDQIQAAEAILLLAGPPRWSTFD